jgi:SAM-dependent methyltransferase
MPHTKLYNSPELYTRGVGFKDVPTESESLLEIYSLFNRSKPIRSLELFAGPALNSKYLTDCGVEAHCLDLNRNMKKFALADKPAKIQYHIGRATDFKLNLKFDLVFSLLDSVAYLLTNEEFVSHLEMVERHLRPGGIYVIEMGHPGSYFSNTGWILEHIDFSKKPQETGDLTLFWGDVHDQIDPIQMILNCTVYVETTVNGKKICLTETAPQRIYLYNEVKLLVEKVKGLEIVGWYGGLSPLCPFTNAPEAWRMIPVIRKKRSRARAR